MILKVSDGNGGWVWIDRVGEAKIDRDTLRTVKSIEELDRLLDGNGSEAILIAKSCFDGEKEVTVATLEYIKDRDADRARRAFISSDVYLCNDQGDTLEKQSVKQLATQRG